MKKPLVSVLEKPLIQFLDIMCPCLTPRLMKVFLLEISSSIQRSGFYTL